MGNLLYFLRCWVSEWEPFPAQEPSLLQVCGAQELTLSHFSFLGRHSVKGRPVFSTLTLTLRPSQVSGRAVFLIGS